MQKNESSDEEPGLGSRQQRGGKDLHAKPEELDASSLDPNEAGKKFRKAEKREYHPTNILNGSLTIAEMD